MVTESGMNVNVHDEGQTGVKEVTGSVPAEEKIYAVRYYIIFFRNKLRTVTTGHRTIVIIVDRRLDNNHNSVHRNSFM